MFHFVVLVAVIIDLSVLALVFTNWSRENVKGSIFISATAMAALIVAALSYVGRFLSPGYVLAISFLPVSAWYIELWTRYKDRKALWRAEAAAALVIFTLSGFFVHIDLALPIGEWPVSYFVILCGFAGSAITMLII